MTTVTKSPTRQSLPHPSEQSQRRNVYDCDGEYELPIARHWVAAEAWPSEETWLP
jgi:hypothetical protein